MIADMEEFFRFKNQREPPSLADHGSLWSGNKSDILECIKTLTGRSTQARQATIVLLDTAVVIHMLRPTSAKTFAEHETQHMIPFLESQLKPTFSHIDAIWDSYPEESFKTLTHQCRGTGPWTRIGSGSTQIPVTLFPISLVLFVVQTSKLSHIVAYGKANKFLTSNVKGEGQGHMKGQNNLFGHSFYSVCRRDFQLTSYCTLWKSVSCMTLTLIFDLDLNKFPQGQSFQEDWREVSSPSRIETIKFFLCLGSNKTSK